MQASAPALTAEPPEGTRAGQKIRAYREARGISAAVFGGLFDPPVPEQTVYSWERLGRRARPGYARRLDALGVCTPADWMEPPAPEAADADPLATDALTGQS